MKKFGRKLVLSGLALAATAATLSTSTYAWYVTNTTADVDGGTAATAGTSVGGNLLVAPNVKEVVKDESDKDVETGYRIAGSYSNKTTLEGNYDQEPGLYPATPYVDGYYVKTTDTDVVTDKTYYTYAAGTGYSDVSEAKKENIASYYEKLTLDYVKTADEKVKPGKEYFTLEDGNYTSGTLTVGTAFEIDTETSKSTGKIEGIQYYEAVKWMDVDGKPVAEANAYQEVSFWVLSTDASTVNIATTVENATTADKWKDQILLNAAGKPDAKEGDDDLAINDTFHMDAVQALRFEVTKTPKGGEAERIGVYSIEQFMSTYEANATCATGGDSNAYYTAVMGKNPLGGTTTATNGTAFTSFTVSPKVETKITIRIWLEGTDAQCFDSCINQSIKYYFDLSVASE